ncbi:hypothetical protein [Streptomyces sp. NPDC017964]|uniref:hypothetical protein n=1 Tax=Streptomyces sp. NPDC017964 TaxID=3365022 RepID=UPI0037A7111B
MTERTAKSDSPPEKRGGLPENSDALSAFALSQAAATAFAPPARKPQQAVQAPVVPLPSGEDPAAQPAVPAGDDARTRRPVPSGPSQAVEPEMHVREVASEQTTTQAMAMVSDDVRRRFEHYQTLQRQQSGHEPTNAVVIRRAFVRARRDDCFSQLLDEERRRQKLFAQEDDSDADDLFGDVPSRKAARGRTKGRVQLSFRPSRRELAVYDGWAEAYRFDNRSDFLNAVLAHFLPDLPQRRGR